MLKSNFNQPKKIIPFEPKYRKKRFSHVPQGIINPLHVYNDPRKPPPSVDIAIESNKVVLNPVPLEKTQKTKAFIPEDLKTPFIYIKRIIPKNNGKFKYWNPSGNTMSLRVDKSIDKKTVTELMAEKMPENGEDANKFLKGFLKNTQRLMTMKLFGEITSADLDFLGLFQGFCKIKRLKNEAKDELLLSRKHFVEFFKMLGWEKAGFSAEDLETFFNLTKIDDENVYFKRDEKPEFSEEDLQNSKNLSKSPPHEVKTQNFAGEKKNYLANSQKKNKKSEGSLSIKAFAYNYEKFCQQKGRIKSLTSIQACISRAEKLRNLISEYLKDYPVKKASFKLTLFHKIAYLLGNIPLYPHGVFTNITVTSPLQRNSPLLDEYFMENNSNYLQNKQIKTGLYNNNCTNNNILKIPSNNINNINKNINNFNNNAQEDLMTNSAVYIETYRKLREIAKNLLFETTCIIRFLGNKRFPDDLDPESLLLALEEKQKNEEESLKIMGDFLQAFKKEKQHFKEETFTLYEIVEFIYEQKYKRKDFDILTKMINKAKNLFNYSRNQTKNQEIHAKQSISLTILTQSLNAFCHKAYISSEILSNFIEKINNLLIKNLEFYKPNNIEIHKALQYNLSLDFVEKYLENLLFLSQKLLGNLDRLHSNLDLSPEILQHFQQNLQKLHKNEADLPNNHNYIPESQELFIQARLNAKMQQLFEETFIELNEEFKLNLEIKRIKTTKNPEKSSENLQNKPQFKPNLPEFLGVDSIKIEKNREDDQIIELLNTKISPKDKEKNEKASILSKKSPKSSKKPSFIKPIKRNFIDIPELLLPLTIVFPLELFKLRPYEEKLGFLGCDEYWDIKIVEKLGVLLDQQPIDFQSTSKSFFVEKSKENPFAKEKALLLNKEIKHFDEKIGVSEQKAAILLDKSMNNEAGKDKMARVNSWMKSLNEEKTANNQKIDKEIDNRNEELNLSQMLLQAKQKKDPIFTNNNLALSKLERGKLEETLNKSYYKPNAVEIGKYNVKSDNFREYELYLPANYYTKLALPEEKDQSKWYVRPHHIETVTGFV